MLQITKKLGKKLWADDNDDYPQVVFDSIKDNPRFTDLVITYDHSEGKAWHMLLFLEIVRSLWDHPACGDILAKFAALTCEELQHERFESARPYITENAVWVRRIISSIFITVAHDPNRFCRQPYEKLQSKGRSPISRLLCP